MELVTGSFLGHYTSYSTTSLDSLQKVIGKEIIGEPLIKVESIRGGLVILLQQPKGLLHTRSR